MLSPLCDASPHGSVHPYRDVRLLTDRSKSQTRSFIRRAPRGSRIWIDEVGAEAGRGQAVRVRHLVNNLALQRGIERLYYYYLCTTFEEGPDQQADRGLLAHGCERGDDLRRAAFDEYKNGSQVGRPPGGLRYDR